MVPVGAWAPDLLITCPDLPGLLRVPLENFGSHDPAALARLELAGSPRFAALAPDGAAIYVSHLHHPVLDRVDLTTGVSERIGLTTACADGLDNDGDGLVDALDPGCAEAADDDEGNDRTAECANGLDDDGDGLTDGADQDCPTSEFALSILPACGNGVDDDEDGATDAPDDLACYGRMDDSEIRVTPRLAGSPTVSPDGVFVYVPMTHPTGVVVAQTAPFARVSLTGPEGPSPNVLLAHLGFGDFLPVGPPSEVLMHAGAGGTEAFLALQSGQIMKITVDEAGVPRHRLLLDDDTQESAATAPVLRANGVEVDRSLSLHPEYPSFGTMTVALIAGDAASRYSYYGIRFHGNTDLELTETWKVTYEGALPDVAGRMGLYAADSAEWIDPTADFCAAGVMVGDRVVLKLEASMDCLGLADRAPEYAIVGVLPDRVLLAALENGPALPEEGCLPSPMTYEVRPADTWTVVGSRSGFLHNQISQDGACVTRPDAVDGFTGRAFTSQPMQDVALSACPPVDRSPEINWQTFSNVSFMFEIVPPCLQDLDFKVTVLPVARDTELSFSVYAGIDPVSVAVGGMPVGLQVVDTSLYTVDQAQGVIHVLDPEDLGLELSHY